MDGTVAAYRFPYLMLGDSLVLKQESPYYEHFYVALRPWKHYVPVRRNLSDLLEKVKWAKVCFMPFPVLGNIKVIDMEDLGSITTMYHNEIEVKGSIIFFFKKNVFPLNS